MPAKLPLLYSGHIPPSIHEQEAAMARYLHFACGALLLSLACASTYVLCSENTLAEAAALYLIR